MQTVSALYKKEMTAQNRGLSSARVRLGVVDLDAVATITQLTGSNQAAFSRMESTVYENGVPARVYATFEPGRMRLDGSQIILPAGNPQPQGYVSNTLSDATGAWSTPPVIDIRFSKTHQVAALSFVFDKVGFDWPSDFTIEAYRAGKLILTQSAAPTSPEFVSNGKIAGFDRLRFLWKRSAHAYRRARLQSVLFGVGLLLEGNILLNLSQVEEADPLSRRLPVGKFNVSLNNLDGAYNPDNPSSLWDLMEKQSPIWLQYGQFIREGLLWGDGLSRRWEDAETSTWRAARFGGTTEIVNGGRYYLTAKPAVSGFTAQFEGHTLLSRMTEPFLLTQWKQQTLYDMAVCVLENAQLPTLDDGKKPWKLWDGLRDITTAGYLPKTSAANCLQLIANAACCRIFVGRDGYLRIEPEANIQHKMHLNLETQTALPHVEKTETVRSVACKCHQYRADTTQPEPTELHKMAYDVSGTACIFVEFSSPSAQVAAKILSGPAGSSVTCSPYVHGARLTLSGTGRIEVLVTGRTIQTSSVNIYHAIQNADENGSIEHINNPLVTSTQRASALACWVGEYLERRTAYTLQHRGNPALEPLDNVFAQSLYHEKFPATVLHAETGFDGVLTGKCVVKRK